MRNFVLSYKYVIIPERKWNDLKVELSSPIGCDNRCVKFNFPALCGDVGYRRDVEFSKRDAYPRPCVFIIICREEVVTVGSIV